MAVVIADEGVVMFDDTDGTAASLVNLSGDILNFQLATNINGSTYHTLGNRWAVAAEGGIGGTLTLTFVDDTTATEAAGLFRAWLLHASNKGGARSMQVQTPDATTGSTQYAFNVKAGGGYGLASLTGGSGDVSQNSLTLNVDGAITATTIA